jgi:antitoxin MazE
MKVTIAKWGNSAALRLPKSVSADLGLSPGVQLDLVVKDGEIRLRRPAKSSKELLQDMIAEMDRLGPENRPELVDWGPDVGAEIIDDDYSRGLISPPGGRPRMGRSKANSRPRTGRHSSGGRAHRS